ncbi:Gfo/Idh/MocA family oxidoreductase [Nocardiopsis coralliicola]
MSGEHLRAGLVGLGMMGRNHARILDGLEGVDLVAVADPDAKQDAVPPGAQLVRTVDDLLRIGVDYAVVACPTALHADVGAALAAAGAAALIEKPLAGSVNEAERLAEAFERSGTVAGVGHIERFNPALRALRERLTRGELGEIYQVTTRRQGPFPFRISDVGVVKDLATHDIDLTGWVTGQHYASVAAHAVSKSGNAHEDMVAAIGRLSGGAMVSHLVNWLSPLKERSAVVTGERGCFVADTLTADLTFYANGVVATEWEALRAFRGVAEGDMVRYALTKREPLLVEHESFRDAVLAAAGGGAADSAADASAGIVTLREGTGTVAVAEALLDSARGGRVVLLGPAVPVQAGAADRAAAADPAAGAPGAPAPRAPGGAQHGGAPADGAVAGSAANDSGVEQA